MSARPSTAEARPSQAAAGALARCIRDDALLADGDLDALLDAEADEDGRMRLLRGLWMAALVSTPQAMRRGFRPVVSFGDD